MLKHKQWKAHLETLLDIFDHNNDHDNAILQTTADFN